MADALTRHDEILNEAVAQAGGTVLKTTGDGMIAVFDRPDSVSAAIPHPGLGSSGSSGERPAHCGCGSGFTPARPRAVKATTSGRR